MTTDIAVSIMSTVQDNNTTTQQQWEYIMGMNTSIATESRTYVSASAESLKRSIIRHLSGTGRQNKDGMIAIVSMLTEAEIQYTYRPGAGIIIVAYDMQVYIKPLGGE